MNHRFKFFLPIFVLVFFLAGCAGLEKKQKQTAVISADQIRVVQEKYHDRVLRQNSIYENTALQLYLDDLSAELIQNSKEEVQLKITVLDASSLNFLVRPSGYLYIDRGLLAHLNNKDQLAAVLAMAAGHTLSKHAELVLEQNLKSQLLLPLMATLQNIQSGKSPNTDSKLSENALELLFKRDEIQRYSPSQVFRWPKQIMLEADTIARDLLRQAGYSDTALLDVHDLMRRYASFSGLLGRKPTPVLGHGHLNHKGVTYRPSLVELLGLHETSTKPGDAKLPRPDYKFLTILNGLPYGISYSSPQIIDGKYVDPLSASSLEFPNNWSAWPAGNQLILRQYEEETLKKRLLVSSRSLAANTAPEDHLSAIYHRRWTFEQLEQDLFRVTSDLENTAALESSGTRFLSGVVKFSSEEAFHVLTDSSFKENEFTLVKIANSLKTASTEDLALLSKKKINLTQVASDESYADLLNRSSDIEHIDKLTRLLNGYQPEEEIVIEPGQRIKLIVDAMPL